MSAASSAALAALLKQFWPLILVAVVMFAVFGWVVMRLFAARTTVQENQPSLFYQQVAEAATNHSVEASVKAEDPTRGLERKLFDAGIDIPASTWRFGCMALAAVAAVFGLLLAGPVPAAIFFAVAVVLPHFYISHCQKKQLLLLEEQLAQAEMQIAESSRCGLPVEKAILATVQACDNPLKSQFERVYNEITYGGSNMADALSNFAQRTSNTDADHLAAMVAVQQESGSSLSAALEFLAENVQKRIEMRQTLRARIADVKLSAVISAGMPVIVFLFCCASMDGFWEFYSTQPIGWMFMAAFVVMEMIGGTILYRMSDMKMD